MSTSTRSSDAGSRSTSRSTSATARSVRPSSASSTARRRRREIARDAQAARRGTARRCRRAVGRARVLPRPLCRPERGGGALSRRRGARRSRRRPHTRDLGALRPGDERGARVCRRERLPAPDLPRQPDGPRELGRDRRPVHEGRCGADVRARRRLRHHRLHGVDDDGVRDAPARRHRPWPGRGALACVGRPAATICAGSSSARDRNGPHGSRGA